jgi:hypothetical protein
MRRIGSICEGLNAKITEDNLWITLGNVSPALGQYVNNQQVTHSSKNSKLSYARQFLELCTTLVHRIFVLNNRLKSRLIPIIHTTNNYYYINK